MRFTTIGAVSVFLLASATAGATSSQSGQEAINARDATQGQHLSRAQLRLKRHVKRQANSTLSVGNCTLGANSTAVNSTATLCNSTGTATSNLSSVPAASTSTSTSSSISNSNSTLTASTSKNATLQTGLILAGKLAATTTIIQIVTATAPAITSTVTFIKTLTVLPVCSSSTLALIQSKTTSTTLTTSTTSTTSTASTTSTTSTTTRTTTTSAVIPVATVPTTSTASAFMLTAPYFVIYSDQWVNQGMPPPSSSLQGFNVYILGFWLLSGPADMAIGWTVGTAAQRAAVKADYLSQGIKLMVSAFGSTDIPTSAGADPIATANNLAAFVVKYSLDGVDVDYEDFNAFNGGTAEAWLIAFTTRLRYLLPSANGYIITHAPVAPWFTNQVGLYPGGGYLGVDRAVGSVIDWYNIQFYNQGVTEYITCQGLLYQSVAFQGSSLFQIAASGPSLNKLVIGKPAVASGAANGYMTASQMGACVADAKTKGYNGGLMLWEYPNAPVNFIANAWNNANLPSPVVTTSAAPPTVTLGTGPYDCTAPVSTGGQCGFGFGRCAATQCCSQYGYCSIGNATGNAAYCGAGCQTQFGTCGTVASAVCAGSTPATTTTYVPTTTAAAVAAATATSSVNCALPINLATGTCGAASGNRCGKGNGCSSGGYCGNTVDYLGAGCQPAYGSCTGSTPPTCST